MQWSLFGKKAFEFIITPLKDHKKIIILSGSVRSGKTVAMIPKWLTYIQSIKGLKLIVGVSKDTIYDNVLSDLFDTLGASNYKYNQTNGYLQIRYKDKATDKYLWTVCKVIGAKDEGSEKYLRGKTIAGAYVDEGTLIPQSFFKQLLNRCSVEGAKIFITTNPDSPIHYLYQDYITNQDRSNIVEFREFYLDDNPNLSQEYIDFISNAYSGVEYDRFIKGLWRITDGLLCSEFSDSNLNKTVRYCKDETIHLCCDFNYSKPMMWVIAHKDEKNIYYFDEIVMEKTTTEKAALEFVRRYGDHIGNIVLNGDYAGTFNNTRSERHDYAQIKKVLMDSGIDESRIKTELCPNPNIRWRIASFNNKLRKPDGEIGIYINPEKCPYLTMNLQTLQWKPGSDEIDLPTDAEILRNPQLRFLGHMFDAASYPVYKYWPIKMPYKHIEQPKEQTIWEKYA